MEQVLNAGLRNQAFIKFMAFFMITTFVIVVAVYFDFKIPSKDNEMLREKIKTYESQVYNQQQFINATQTAKNLMDSMNKSGQYSALLDREIARQLEIMKNSDHQGSIFSTMNKDVFNVLYDYNELNTKFINSKDAVQQVERLQNSLNQCEARLAGAQRDLDVYRKGSSLGL